MKWIAALYFVFSSGYLCAQTQQVTANDIRALQRIQLKGMWVDSISIDSTFSAASNSKIPTALAVKKYLNSQTNVVSGSFSANSETVTIIVNTLTADAIIMLPLCTAALHGRTVRVEKQGADIYAARINIPGGNTWRYGSTKAMFGQGIVGECTCTFISGAGQWAFSPN